MPLFLAESLRLSDRLLFDLRLCLIHRGVMTAKLTVAGPGATAQTPADVTAAGTKQFNDTVAAVTPAAQAAQKATPDKATLGTGDVRVTGPSGNWA